MAYIFFENLQLHVRTKNNKFNYFVFIIQFVFDTRKLS